MNIDFLTLIRNALNSNNIDIIDNSKVTLKDEEVFIKIVVFSKLQRNEYRNINKIIKREYDTVSNVKIKKDKNMDIFEHTYYIFINFNREEDKNRFIMENA